MSRFSGLPEPRTTSYGARFADLPDQLASMSRPERFDRIRADAVGESCIDAAYHRDEMERLGTTKATTAKPAAKPTAALAARSTPAPAAKPTAAAPPPRKLGRTETVALALKTDPKLAGMQDIALHALDDPDLKALSGDGMVRVLQGVDATAYRATMAEQERKARAARADAVWDRARASIDGSPAATASASKPAVEASSRSADDVWTRAYAAVAR